MVDRDEQVQAIRELRVLMREAIEFTRIDLTVLRVEVDQAAAACREAGLSEAQAAILTYCIGFESIYNALEPALRLLGMADPLVLSKLTAACLMDTF